MIHYLIIFGLPILYTIIQIIRFGIFTIKDFFSLFKRTNIDIEEQEIEIENIEEKDPESTFNFDGLDKININMNKQNRLDRNRLGLEKENNDSLFKID